MGNQVTPSDLEKGEKYLVQFGNERFVSIYMGEVKCPRFGFKYVFVGHNEQKEPFLPMALFDMDIGAFVEALP
jgi:hypothetical protein